MTMLTTLTNEMVLHKLMLMAVEHSGARSVDEDVPLIRRVW